MDLKEQIKKLVDKAAATNDSFDAMRYSQAACNVANAMSAVSHLKD